MTTGEISHVSARLLERYARAGTDIAGDIVWAVEAHLEVCGGCRSRLGTAVVRYAPDTTALLQRVQAELSMRALPAEQMPRRRTRLPGWLMRGATPALLPRLAMTVLVVLVAFGLDVVDGRYQGGLPSLVLLLAPVAPLIGVAAAWSRGLDPLHELVVASPRGGLYLVLRRTLAVLTVVIPALTVAGWLVGSTLARWLLPCLAFTLGALALGGVIGLRRAATGLVLVWTALVVAPSLITATPTVLLERASLPAWAGVTVLMTAALLARRGAYQRLPSGR